VKQTDLDTGVRSDALNYEKEHAAAA